MKILNLINYMMKRMHLLEQHYYLSCNYLKIKGRK